MFAPTRSIRHLQRYSEIVAIFARHGFGFLFLRSDSKPRRWFRASWRAPQKIAPPPEDALAVHFRTALEELGPTFIKFGQILSTRADLLPPSFIAELGKLVDSVSPEPWELIRTLLTRELEKPLDTLFASINPQPMASASLSQVHAGVLPDGREVVIKVQRPNIASVIDTDLEIMASLAASAQTTALGSVYDFMGIADDFSFTLRNELDYQREGRNADRLRESFTGQEKLLYIPKVYWELSTQRVLVMERIHGIKISDIPALDAAGYDRHKVALNSASATVKQVLEDGFFHADPHAGNYLIMPGEAIGLVDFGKVGYLRDKDRMDLIRLYIVAIEMDVDGLIDQLVRIGAVREDADRNRLASDLSRFLNKYNGVPIKYIRARELIDEITTITFRHRLRLPSTWWLVGQTIVMLEGIGLQLDPDFDVFKAAEPHVQTLMKNLLLPNGSWVRSVLMDATNWGEMLHRLPRVGNRMLERLERNEPLRMEIKDTDHILTRLDRLVTRLSLSLLVAAFVVGLPLLIPLTTPDSLPRWLLLVGMIPIVGAGIWLGFSLLNTPRK
ncbi:MAG TPA: AarF/ABC1/UbiB kinase family protein [Anaerolineales bacterium]|nr:AarF/ABC1/UbiB kinase family protein [Anaerolineales bacterium]